MLGIVFHEREVYPKITSEGKRSCKTKEKTNYSLTRNGLLRRLSDRNRAWPPQEEYISTTSLHCKTYLYSAKGWGVASRPPKRKCLRIIVILSEQIRHYAPKDVVWLNREIVCVWEREEAVLKRFWVAEWLSWQFV